MHERLFVDTLFVIALVNRRDQYHQHAVEVSQQLEGDPLVTTDVVLFEIGNALARTFKTEAIDIIEEFIQSDDVTIIHLSPSLFEQAFDLYKTYQD